MARATINRGRRRARWLALGMCAALVTAMGVAYAYYPQWLATRIAARLSKVDDQEAVALVRQATGLGEPGIKVLVSALASRRPALVEAAREELIAEMERWELFPPTHAARRLMTLAESLAAHLQGFDARGRDTAALLATRMLLWPSSVLGPQRGELVVTCETILRGCPSRSPEEIARRDASRQAAAQVAQETVASEDAAEQEKPSDALPVEPTNIPHTDDAEDEGSETNSDPLLTDGGEPRFVPPRTLNADSSEAQPLEDAKKLADDGLLSPGPEEVERRQSEPRTALRSAPTTELMQRLHAGDSHAVESARAELARRGFAEAHIELAFRLTDPDPEVRQAWARRLPGMKGVDAHGWLLWLGRDEDPDVRLTALTLLATTGDRATLEQVSRLAQQDSDPRIRLQAEQIIAARLRPEEFDAPSGGGNLRR